MRDIKGKINTKYSKIEKILSVNMDSGSPQRNTTNDMNVTDNGKEG